MDPVTPPRLTLAWSGALSLEIDPFGASLARLRAPLRDGPADLVVPSALAGEIDYAQAGRLIGRHAGRIRDARFRLDGREIRLHANFHGHQLHGGAGGFHSRWWTVEHVETSGPARRAVLSLISPDGEEGFPGTMTVTATYELAPDGVTLTIEARTDAPSPASFSLHPYFNLSGDPLSGIDDHELFINASDRLAVDPELLPLGSLQPLAGTAADFSTQVPIGERLARQDALVRSVGGLDHSFVLNGGAPAARLACPRTGLALEIDTDQPCLQVYSGQIFGRPDMARPALALEPQPFPDAVNHPEFPDVILRPGGRAVWRSNYRISAF